MNHHEGAEPTEVTAVFLDARVVTAPAGSGDGGEVFSGGDALFQGEGLVPGRSGVERGGFGAEADEQVGGADFLEGAVIGLLNEGVEQRVVDEVGAGQLGAVSGELRDEGGGGVHAEVFGGLDLQLEVDEQLHVLIERLGRHDAVAVVLLEDVGEVIGAHGFPGHGHHGLGVGEGKEDGQSEQAKGSAERGGKGHGAHRGEWMAEFSPPLAHDRRPRGADGPPLSFVFHPAPPRMSFRHD